MLRRFFGPEKATRERAFGHGTNNMGLEVTQGTLKAEDINRSPGNLNITQSLPDLTISTAIGSNLERIPGEQRQDTRTNCPKDSLESVNESVCSDPISGQFQNKSENVYRSVENLLGVEKSRVPSARRVFSLKKSSSKNEQFEDLPKGNQSSSNSASLLSADSHRSDLSKSETKLNEAHKNLGTTKEKSATFGSRTFMELLHIDSGTNPDKLEESLNVQKNKRSTSKSRKRARTLTGLEFLKSPEVFKNKIPDADGIQSDRDNQGAVLSRQVPEWRSASVKGTRTSKYSEVTGTPSKADNISTRATMTQVPISKLDDHLVLALDGLEENSEVQVVKVDASSLPFKPEELATYQEDTWHINKALINLNCIAVLLPSSRHSSHGLANLLPPFESAVKKLCAAKGSVALSRVQGTWSYSRYLFLTSEELLVMKQKTATTFKLKKRVAVRDLWLAPNPGHSGEVGSSSLPLSFIIGWPLATNYLLLFTKAEQKMMWMTLLEKQIIVERQKDLPKEVVIKITTQDTNYAMMKSLVVNAEETAFQVVQRCLKELHLADSAQTHFELCVKTRDNIIHLIGHEIPFYIQRDNSREQDHQEKVTPQDNVTMTFDHFILRPKKVPPRNGFRRRARNRRLTLVGLFGKKSASPQPDVLQSMPEPKLFGRSLSEVCSDDLLPKPILEMLKCLYIHGPTTPGIFRKPGNHRDLLELKARLDAGEECNIDGISIHVATSAVKNWLRSLPDCLLLSRLYSQWIEAICIADSENKINSMKRLVQQLPHHNVLLLRYLICVLHRVGSQAGRNHMTSGNLAICLGPTILWPEGSIDLTSECVSVELVARITQLFIDDARQILGENSLELFKDSVEEVPLETELNFESEDSMGSHEVLNTKGDLEKDASLESLDNYSFDESLDTHSYSAAQSQMSMDSGLAVSNPQLNDELDPPAIIIQAPTDQPRYAKRHLAMKKKVHSKSELSDISEALTIQDAEERPNSKMAGASNVRERINRFQASKVNADDFFSGGENFESSDDEFMQTSISSSENFVEVNSNFGDANSNNDGTSREFEDNYETEDSEGNGGLMVSEIMKRALPAPVNVERQISDWHSQKVDVSIKEVDKPVPTLDQKIQKDLSDSGYDWYFMGPEENVQSNSSILKSLPDKQKSKCETFNKTSDVEVQGKQGNLFQNRYKLSSNSVRYDRSEKNEPTIQPVKQNSLDNAFHNSITDSSAEVKPTQTAKPQPAKLILNKSNSTPLCLHLTSFEVLENQASQQIHSSQDCKAESPANSIAVSPDNLNSDSLYHRSGRNISRRLTDVGVNTSDSLFRNSRSVQTENLHDQNVSSPVGNFRLSSPILSGNEMNDLSPQTERYADKEQKYAFGRSVHPGEQVPSLSDEYDHCESHNQVRRMSVPNVMRSRESTEFSDHLQVVQNNAPVSIKQRIRDHRAITVVTIGDVASRPRSRNNKLVHQPTTICIPADEFSASPTENQRSDNKGSKIDGKPLRGNMVEIHSNGFNQTSNSRSVQDYAPSSSRMRPMYALNTPSAKLELQSCSDTLNNFATSKRLSGQLRSLASTHGMDDHKHRSGSQNFGASRSIDSCSNQLHTPQKGSKFPKNSSVSSTSLNGEIVHRGSLKQRGEGHRDHSQNVDAALRITLHSVENSWKDNLMRDDSQRHNDAKGHRSPMKPVVASHQFDIGKMVEACGDDSKIRSPVKAEDSITWSVNELRKRFDMALPNARFTQQKAIVKK